MAINKKDFDNLRVALEKEDALRETIIKESRDVVKLSKNVIYSVHRNDMDSAKKSSVVMEKSLKSLVALTKKHPAMYYSGTIKIAEQEFVEAMLLLTFVSEGTLPTSTKLEVSKENYLLGVCDLFGELSRRATNSAIRKDYKQAMAIKELASDLYEELMRFDFRNSELRRKFDTIKYEVKKLENLALELHLGKKV